MAEPVTLTDEAMHVIPSTCSGPLGEGLSALLIGRSLISWQGIFILPGLIDANYKGIIKIMVKVFRPLVTIPAGSRIAQLIPFKGATIMVKPRERGTDGFGSTGNNLVLFAEAVTAARPNRTVQIQGLDGTPIRNVTMMMDTGSDVAIIPFDEWPLGWELLEVAGQVMGIVGTAKTHQSKNFVTIIDPDGNMAGVRPYVIHTPLWVLGRDALSQWRLVIQMPF